VASITESIIHFLKLQLFFIINAVRAFIVLVLSAVLNQANVLDLKNSSPRSHNMKFLHLGSFVQQQFSRLVVIIMIIIIIIVVLECEVNVCTLVK